MTTDKPEPTPEALKDAERHRAAAEAHERRVAVFEQGAVFLDERGEHAQAEAQRKLADDERDRARSEWDRAYALQGPTQFTEPNRGEPVEIPIPTRDAFLRDLEKVAPPSFGQRTTKKTP
ncbi:MAG TPA: hypothetical protein VHX66_18185 [Solirubrobacteraceae bacterium]|jgi:hypothetical protein|nr:hypothetical protein [Solirubrobacteraceae bacterium]